MKGAAIWQGIRSQSSIILQSPIRVSCNPTGAKVVTQARVEIVAYTVIQAGKPGLVTQEGGGASLPIDVVTA